MDIKKRIKEIWYPDPRLDKILEEENFYGYESMFQYWEILRDLMHQDRRKPKIMGSLLTAKSHAGKTTIVKQFVASYIENIPGAKESDILYFPLIDRGTSFKSVIAELCRELKIPDIPSKQRHLANYHTSYFINKAAMKLKNDKKLVIIDELEKLYEVSHESRGEILAGFHTLINKSNCPIAIVGIEGVDDILQNIASDKYAWLKGPFSTRFPETKIFPWEDGEEFVNLLLALDRDCLLRPDPSTGGLWYKNEEIRNLILDLSEGLLGKIILLVKFTTRHLIRRQKSEVITAEELSKTAIRLEAVGWDLKELNKAKEYEDI